MNVAECLAETSAEARTMARAKVRSVDKDARVLCECDGELVSCEFLQTSDAPPPVLAPGDTVLVWFCDPDREAGVILGRLGSRRKPAPKSDRTPDELVIEAKRQLTFRCGEGSITLRTDGKVLIKGKDLVSHARRMNRIKGGAVAIN
jgi:hypothetical protein